MIDAGPAVRAAVTVAAAHGVSCAEPVVVRNGSNILVHLAPSPVVARVASLTARVRPEVTATLAKDLAVAGYLANRGAPVVAPSTELPVGPHQYDGHSLTFWTYVEHERDHVCQPAELGPLLADLHAELRDFPGELPAVPPLDVPEILAFLDGEPLLSDDDRAALVQDSALLTDTLTGMTPAVPLHGDAHPGNLMYTRHGPVWTDFEDAWRGPVGWDLACLAETGRLDGRAAVAGYPGAPDERVPAQCVAARQVQSIVWTLVFLRCFPDPARQDDFVRLLAKWRGQRPDSNSANRSG
jgi:hypothetical protein